eukprot:5505670-Pleurochrysis_carterae.AAC.1
MPSAALRGRFEMAPFVNISSEVGCEPLLDGGGIARGILEHVVGQRGEQRALGLGPARERRTDARLAQVRVRHESLLPTRRPTSSR